MRILTIIINKRETLKPIDLIQCNLHPQRHRKDVSNFDRQFTSEGTELTPTDKLFMMNLDQVEMLDVS